MAHNPSAWRHEKRETSQRTAAILVKAIPQDELPDPLDRADLMAAVMAGDVDYIYTPLGAPYHNLTITELPTWVDPRLRVTAWAAMRREGKDMPAIRAAMVAEAKARMGLAPEQEEEAR